jgi:hypothetical protein
VVKAKIKEDAEVRGRLNDIALALSLLLSEARCRKCVICRHTYCSRSSLESRALGHPQTSGLLEQEPHVTVSKRKLAGVVAEMPVGLRHIRKSAARGGGRIRLSGSAKGKDAAASIQALTQAVRGGTGDARKKRRGQDPLTR